MKQDLITHTIDDSFDSNVLKSDKPVLEGTLTISRNAGE